jgi:hypothetical protein
MWKSFFSRMIPFMWLTEFDFIFKPKLPALEEGFDLKGQDKGASM